MRKRTATNAGLDAHTDSGHATGNIDIASLNTSNSRPGDDARDKTETPSRSAWLTGQYGDDGGLAPRELSPSSGIMIDPALQVSSDNAEDMTDRGYSSNSNNIAFNDLQNPSDALGILAQIAEQGESTFVHFHGVLRPRLTSTGTQCFNAPLTVGNYGQSQLDYALIRDGRLSMSKILELLQIYKHYYHPFFPLVPSATLEASNLPTTARDEQHLLTAVLVIASRDLIDEPHVFMACSEYMRTLVSALAAGGPGNVEAVEVCADLRDRDRKSVV